MNFKVHGWGSEWASVPDVCGLVQYQYSIITIAINFRLLTLSFDERVKLIEMREKNDCPGRYINKDSIMQEWMSWTSSALKRRQTTENDNTKNAVYEWFVRARAKNILLSGLMIQAEARKVAAKVGSTTSKLLIVGRNHSRLITMFREKTFAGKTRTTLMQTSWMNGKRNSLH